MTSPTRTRTGSDLPTRLADRLRRNGGFTVSPRTGQDVTSGYAVATYPECERQILGRVNPDDIRDYAFTHAATLVRDGNVLGAWVDGETGITYLDISRVVYDRGEALALAREHNQLAVFNLSNGTEIRA